VSPDLDPLAHGDEVIELGFRKVIGRIDRLRRDERGHRHVVLGQRSGRGQGLLGPAVDGDREYRIGGNLAPAQELRELGEPEGGAPTGGDQPDVIAEARPGDRKGLFRWVADALLAQYGNTMWRESVGNHHRALRGST
jgi:hypothetical protein